MWNYAKSVLHVIVKVREHCRIITTGQFLLYLFLRSFCISLSLPLATESYANQKKLKCSDSSDSNFFKLDSCYSDFYSHYVVSSCTTATMTPPLMLVKTSSSIFFTCSHCFSFFRLSWASVLGQCWTQRLTLMRYLCLQLFHACHHRSPSFGYLFILWNHQ